MTVVLEAALGGLIGGSSLLLGAVLGLRLSASRHAIGLIMGFGAGVLISALAFELTEEAFEKGGGGAVAAGLGAGALAFFAGNEAINRRGGAMRKRSEGQPSGGSAAALTLGALMDGIPESVVIGMSVLGGEGLGVAVVAAVFLSNLPESLSAATGMRKAGRSSRYVLGLWASVMAVTVLAALLGYAALDGAPEDLVAVIEAFAAGAILTMLVDTMIPEAYEQAGRFVGLMSALGFGLAFLISTLE